MFCINNTIKKRILLYFNIVFLNIIFIIYNYIHILYVCPYTDIVLWVYLNKHRAGYDITFRNL